MYCNLKLQGKNEKLEYGRLTFREMTDALNLQQKKWITGPISTVLGWSWFATKGIYGPLLMCVSKTAGHETFKCQYKSKVGRFARYLKSQQENIETFSSDMRDIYEILINGKPRI